jgi:hypothetical protein
MTQIKELTAAKEQNKKELEELRCCPGCGGHGGSTRRRGGEQQDAVGATSRNSPSNF